MSSDTVTKKHTELEVKYRVEINDLYPFKNLVEKEFSVESFLFVTGPDHYYVKGESDEFIRFRIANYQEEDGEITIKQKKDNGNNINRTEVNLRLKNPKIEDVDKFANLLGFERNFTIVKDCHIYFLSDAVLCFYSVTDGAKPPHFFIEIEVKEDVFDALTFEESWDILRFYENKLSAIGISPQKRIKKSLFEMFRRTGA